MNKTFWRLHIRTSSVRIGQCRYRTFAIGTTGQTAIAFTLITKDKERAERLRKEKEARETYRRHRPKR